jgi:hypothetical protein
MGILYHDAKMLWEARLSGASFERVATIGHLRLSLHPSEGTDSINSARS